MEDRENRLLESFAAHSSGSERKARKIDERMFNL